MPIAKNQTASNYAPAKAGFFIGIDPGQSGGFAVLDVNGILVETFPMAKSTDHEIVNWLSIRVKMADGKFPIKAALEKVGAMPGQGVVAMFTFGKSYGFLRGLLAALEVPYIEVMPKAWQGRFSIARKKTEQKPAFKKRLQAKAHERWPSKVEELTLATSDAALIAEYLRLEEIGSR